LGAVISYLGIDIGGTKVALRATGEHPRTYDTAFRWPQPGGLAEDLEALAKGVDAVNDHWNMPIDAVGIAVPATMDSSGRVITWPGRPGWTGLDLRGTLHGLFPGALIRWADDGDLAALAEAREAGCENLVYAGVGTGVGGGIVLHGRLCPGTARGSCEVGHMVVDPNGPLCDCGRRGCVQASASGPATLRRAAALRGGPVDFAELREALEERLPWAVTAVDESCATLATALTSLSEVVHPELAVVGGGFAAGLPGFVEEVARRTEALARPGRPAVPVRRATLGGLSSLRGAVLLAQGAA